MTSGGSTDLLARARSLEEARDYGGVVSLLEPVDPSALTGEPELGYRLAYAWRRVGRSRDALPLVESLDPPIRRAAVEGLWRRRLSLEAMVRYDLGEVGRAEQLWEQLAAAAAEAGDHVLAAAASNNLGVVRTLQDRPEEALAAYTRALVASRGLGDRRGMAQAHQNLGILFREKRLRRESASHFRQAGEHARASRSDDVLGRVEEERALLFLDQEDEPMATATARRALERFESIGDRSGVGEAGRVLGIAALRRRDAGGARAALESALEAGEDAGNALLRAETLEALAVLEQAESRGSLAAGHRRNATALFDEIGALPWGRRIRARTAELAGY